MLRARQQFRRAFQLFFCLCKPHGNIMRPAISEPRGRRDTEGVLAVAETGVEQMRIERIGAQRRDESFSVENIHAYCGVRRVLVPCPAYDFLAVHFFQSAHVATDLARAEMARKNQQAEANKVKRQ